MMRVQYLLAVESAIRASEAVQTAAWQIVLPLPAFPGSAQGQLTGLVLTQADKSSSTAMDKMRVNICQILHGWDVKLQKAGNMGSGKKCGQVNLQAVAWSQLHFRL
jgi:hypothetical protein